MAGSYFPGVDPLLAAWLNNYKTKIGTYGSIVGLTNDEIMAEQTYCGELLTALTEVELKKTALKAAVSAKAAAIETKGGALRTEIGRFKKHPGYTEAIGKELGVVGVVTAFDAATFKAKITAELFGGAVRIKFVKNGVEGINIYHRKKGSTNWLFLARDTKSPYDDHITLTNAQPEHWEYRAFGVLNDAEIGLPSDIVEIVFGA